MGLGKRLVQLALLATLLGGTATVLAPEAFAARAADRTSPKSISFPAWTAVS